MINPTLKNEIINLIKPSNVYNLGPNNPDIRFYVIQQESPGRGLFSIFTGIIQHIFYALTNNLIPVIDLENFGTTYNNQNNFNLWTVLFEPISIFSLDEVYQSKNVYFSNSYFPPYGLTNLSECFHLENIFTKYFIINESYSNYISTKKNEIECNISNCLGVHARGREMRYAKGHRFPPSIKQIINNILFLTNKYEYEKIFLVTEDPDVFNKIKQKFGDKIISYNVPREKFNLYRYGDDYRLNHKLNLAKEIFLETITLAKCKSLIGSTSNVTYFASLINNGYYSYKNIITNPYIINIPILYLIQWHLQSRLPCNFGGFNKY